MKRLNIRFLAILATVTLALVVTIVAVNFWQRSRNATKLVQRADAAREQGDPREASQQRNRYLKHRPLDIEQWSMLADDLAAVTELPDANRRDINNAYYGYEEALQVATQTEQLAFQYRDTINELRRKAIKFHMRPDIRQYSSAIQHLKLLRQSLGDQADTELDLLTAECLARNRQGREASELFAKLVGYDPESKTFDVAKATAPTETEAYILWAQVAREELLDNEIADAVVEQLVKANPDDYRAHLAYSKYLRQYKSKTSGAMELAEKEANEALRLAPDDPDALLNSAEIERGQGKLKEATELLERGLASHPKDYRLYYGLATLQMNAQDPKKALEYIAEGVKQASDSTALYWLRGGIELEQEDKEGAAETIKTLTKLGYPPYRLRFMQARINFIEGNWPVVATELEAIRPLSTGDTDIERQLNRLLALCYEKLGQADRSLDAWRRILSAQPGDIMALNGEINALRRLRRTAEADNKLLALQDTLDRVGLDPAPQFHERAIRIEIGRVSRLPAAEQNWTRVDEMLSEINRNPKFPIIQKLALNTDVMLLRGREDQAVALVKQALAENQQEFGLWLVALDLVARIKGHEQAFAILERMETNFGDSVTLRGAKANLLLMRRGADVKPELERLAEGVEKFSEAEQVQLWQSLGQAYFQLRDYDQARRLWTKIATARPNDLPIRVALFELAEETGDEVGMDEALAEIEGLEGKESKNNSTWKLYQAKHLIWQLQNRLVGPEVLGTIRQLCEEVRERRADWHELSRTESDLALLQGDVPEATKKLQQSLEQVPGQPVVIRRLVELFIRQGKFDEAQQLSKRLDPAQRASIDPRMQSRLLAVQGDFDESLKLSQGIIEATNHPDDYLWHGQVQFSAGKFDDAIASVRKAIELNSRSSESWLALIRLMLAAGKRDGAEQVVREAQLVLSEKELPMVMGQAYELLQDLPQARRCYLMALSADPNNLNVLRRVVSFYSGINNESATNKYLDQMLVQADPDAQRPDQNIAWARRMKAQLLAGNHSYPSYLEARKLIDMNIPVGGEMLPEDLQLAVRLALARPDSLSREGAVRLLEETRERRRLFSPEILTLAQLYEKQGRWEEANNLMGSLLADNATNPSIVGPYVEMLLRNGEADKVEVWLSKLDPSQPIVKRIRIHTLVQQGKVEEGLRLAMTMLPADLKPEQVEILRFLGALMEDLNDYGEQPMLVNAAEKFYREYARRQPDQAMVLASFLGRHGKVQEAFELCEAAMRSATDESERRRFEFGSLQVAVATLSAHRATIATDSPYYAQARKWFTEIQAEYPDSKSLLSHLAVFEELEGNFDQVISIYRHFLDRNDLSARERAVVQNNLAFILALQGDGEGGMEMITQAINELGPTADLLDTRALVHLARGESFKAIQDLNTSLVSGESAIKYFHLALAQAQERNRSAAAQALENARRLGLVVNELSHIEQGKYQTLVKELGLQEERVSVLPGA